MFKGLRKEIKRVKIKSKKTKDQEAQKLIEDIIFFYKAYWTKRQESDTRKNEILNSIVLKILELFYKFEINLFKQFTWIKKQREYRRKVSVYKDYKGEIVISQSL